MLLTAGFLSFFHFYSLFSHNCGIFNLHSDTTCLVPVHL
uniref:Uncharacterized protein n=1 Tax=Anguilla anguilla TaxID=7936 RepID=A0A0E9T313_ANGAN